MATEQYDSTDILSATTAADLTGKEKLFAILGSGGLNVAGAGVRVVGVIVAGTGSGKVASYQYNGVAKVIAGGNVAKGDSVKSDAAGKAVLAATGNTAGGIALAAGASADVIPVRLALHVAL